MSVKNHLFDLLQQTVIKDGGLDENNGGSGAAETTKPGYFLSLLIAGLAIMMLVPPNI